MPQKSLLFTYSIALLLGIVVGFKVIPPAVVGILFFAAIIRCVIYLAQGNTDKAFGLIPYIIYCEIFVRAHARFLPYLSVQYMYIIGFGALIIKSKSSKPNFHFSSIFLLGSYFLLEIVNGFFPNNPGNTKGVQLNTLALFVPALWASFQKLSPTMINKIMDSLRNATVFLAGIVLVAHLQGKIDYSTASNSEASNNMAPVQLSGYLGTGSILFLFSILNSFDKRSKIVQAVFLITIATLMVLTFSRGGIYFLGIVTIIYMFYNRASFGTYFKFLIFIPIGLIVYNFVIDETGGKIVERYEAKGASNRDKLALVGLYIFTEKPVFGIGTGNFNNYIKKNKLFTVESGAHNEFIRAIAEHGVFGLLLYWGFFILMLIVILRRPKPAKEYALYFFTLFFLITIHNGLKISIQPLLLVLAISIVPSDISITKRISNVSIKQQQA